MAADGGQAVDAGVVGSRAAVPRVLRIPLKTRAARAALQIIDRWRDRQRRRRWDADKALGRRGEDLAHRYLERQGFVIVARNYRLAAGEAEADLVAWDGDELVIVEVKTRISGEFGSPERAVGPDKERHLRRVARSYARKAGVEMERVRIDIVTVVMGNRPGRAPEIELFRGAVGF